MKKIALAKILVIGSTICSCLQGENENFGKHNKQESIVVGDDLMEWYGFALGNTKISQLNDIHHQFTSEKNGFLELFGDKELQKIGHDGNLSQRTLMDFLEDFYQNSVSYTEESEIANFCLKDTNEVFFLHMFHSLILSKTTGHGNYNENGPYYRVYEERTYKEGIQKWNQVGVVPKIFLWSEEEAQLIKKEEFTADFYSVKRMLEELSRDEILDKNYCIELTAAIERILAHTQNLELLKKTNEDEDYTIREKINYQMRYASVNLLRVIVMHYLSTKEANVGKILTYADWVITPTANLKELPSDNFIYGAKVYTGLVPNGGNSIENTAFFYNNIDKSYVEKNVFMSQPIKNFYIRAMNFIECLFLSESEDENTKFKGYFDKRLADVNSHMRSCLCKPSSFRDADSYVYNLFLDLVQSIQENFLKELIVNHPEKNFPKEYLLKKEAIDKIGITLEKQDFEQQKKVLINQLAEYCAMDTEISNEYNTLRKEFAKLETKCDAESCNLEMQNKEKIKKFKEATPDEEERLKYEDSLYYEEQAFKQKKLEIQVDFLEKSIRDAKHRSLQDEYILKKQSEMGLSIPVNTTRRSGHA